MKEKDTVAFNALQRLKEGNEIYLNTAVGVGDVSPSRRLDTAQNGQHPFAVVVSCADSRVIPEAIFSCGIGDLFVIRVAGNVVGNVELGSIEYAVEHLGCRLVVVLGHTGCGAVDAALRPNDGFVRHITEEIKCGIGSECDAIRASVMNALHSAEKIKSAFSLASLHVCAALYHTESGKVDFDLND